jgi:hypothetical protein
MPGPARSNLDRWTVASSTSAVGTVRRTVAAARHDDFSPRRPLHVRRGYLRRLRLRFASGERALVRTVTGSGRGASRLLG